MKNKLGTDIVFAILLGILCIITIALEIYFLGNQSTKLETTLFSILEFVFSVGFAWMLARSSSRREFTESQKSFAVAAYRRIKEIERAVTRLLIRTEENSSDASSDLKNELEVIREIAKGVCDTTRSSVGDWSDIIGEEISTIEKIDELRREQQILEEKNSYSFERINSEIESKFTNEIQKLEETQRKLIDSLPKKLKLIAKKGIAYKSDHRKSLELLNLEYEKNGYLSFQGFWEPHNGFDGNTSELKSGNVLTVKLGDVKGRKAVPVIYDSNNTPIGMIPNNLDQGCLDDFILAVVRCLRSSEFKIKFISFNEEINDRKYFSCQTV